MERIIPGGVEEKVDLSSYGEIFFEGSLRLRESSEGRPDCKMGNRTYVASAEDFNVLMDSLVGRINEWEKNENLMIRGFGNLNKYNLMDGSAPDVYKTGETDSEEFKKLFE